ncbi:MAG: hypothetical protein QUS33_13255, partial [Dehalococcoidia bacterium]|nr:hypothetical protein [Dehalococcoidia bacterium]
TPFGTRRQRQMCIRDRAGLWWLVGVALILLSFVVWLAGLKGKEAVLAIGRRTAARSRERKPATGERLANAFSIVVGIAGILGGLSIILLLGI